MAFEGEAHNREEMSCSIRRATRKAWRDSRRARRLQRKRHDDTGDKRHNLNICEMTAGIKDTAVAERLEGGRMDLLLGSSAMVDAFGTLWI